MRVGDYIFRWLAGINVIGIVHGGAYPTSSIQSQFIAVSMADWQCVQISLTSTPLRDHSADIPLSNIRWGPLSVYLDVSQITASYSYLALCITFISTITQKYSANQSMKGSPRLWKIYVK